MKKSIFILAALTLLMGCKKDSESNDFTAHDVTGTSVLMGNISKNIITPNGNGGWMTTSRIPATPVNISVKVNKSSLYPGSNAQGADVYTAASDANGNYSVTVRSNANGVNAQITVDGFTGTFDTIINGTTKKGLYSSYQGTTINRTLFMGQNSQFDYAFTANVVSTNPNNNLKIGTATITGSLAVNFLKEVQTGTVISITTSNVPLPNYKVYCNFSNDPYSLNMITYETTTDSKGFYSFTINTVAANTPGFAQNANIWVPDYAATRDTVRANGTTVVPGRAGVFSMQSINQNGVYNTNIRNANNLLYLNFTPN